MPATRCTPRLAPLHPRAGAGGGRGPVVGRRRPDRCRSSPRCGAPASARDGQRRPGDLLGFLGRQVLAGPAAGEELAKDFGLDLHFQSAATDFRPDSQENRSLGGRTPVSPRFSFKLTEMLTDLTTT